MSTVTEPQPDGTPTWVDLGLPPDELDRAMDFYRAVFGWDFQVGPEETMRYTNCLLRGRPVAALAPTPDQDPANVRWTMYFATSDCDATAGRVTQAGGTLLFEPMDIMDLGRWALAIDPVGAVFGLWQAGRHIGAEIVNEPGSLVRNDLVTPVPGPAREFYTKVFGFALDGNPDLPGFDFTFLRRPDGKEIGGIMGVAEAPASAWNTTFEVADTDAVTERARAAGGRITGVDDSPYGRMATIIDPFGAEFSIIARPPGQQG
jgi:uncharacterized protein